MKEVCFAMKREFSGEMMWNGNDCLDIWYSLSLLVQTDQSKSRLYAHSMTGKRWGWRECDRREDSNLDAVRTRKRTSI